MNPAVELELRYGASNYESLPVILTRGEGVFLWDDEGKRYFDLMSAYSAVSFGHCHPKLVQALREQAGRLGVVSRAFYTDQLGHFLQQACELTGFDKALPMNSGAEAVETALKAARKWAYTVKGIRANKAEIISCTGNFHGRTIAIISMSSEQQYQEGFGPFLPGLRTIRYGEIQELELAITHNTAAFLVEPIQGEGGLIVPPPGYLKACAELCKKNKVLFLCDEIQTGLGRTGKMLACEHEGVRPDGVMLGKALGGGLLPVSLFLARKEVMNVFHPGDHGSTFGGNPLAAAVGTAALEILTRENLLTQAADLGQYFIGALRDLNSPVIKEVRGKGLMIGLEISPQFSARQVCLTLLKHGILTKETHKTVVRLTPPLIITKVQLDEVLVLLKAALDEIKPREEEATDVEITLPQRIEDEPVVKRKSKPRVRKKPVPKIEPAPPAKGEGTPVEAEAPVMPASEEPQTREVKSAPQGEIPIEAPAMEKNTAPEGDVPVETQVALPLETQVEEEAPVMPVSEEPQTREVKSAEPQGEIPIEAPAMEKSTAPERDAPVETQVELPLETQAETPLPETVAPAPVQTSSVEARSAEAQAETPSAVHVQDLTPVATPAEKLMQSPAEEGAARLASTLESENNIPHEEQKNIEEKAEMSQGSEQQLGTEEPKGE